MPCIVPQGCLFEPTIQVSKFCDRMVGSIAFSHRSDASPTCTAESFTAIAKSCETGVIGLWEFHVPY